MEEGNEPVEEMETISKQKIENKDLEPIQMEVEDEQIIIAEDFSFDNAITISKKKEVTNDLQNDPVFGGEISTPLKLQITEMQTKLNEIEEQYSAKDFSDMHPRSLVNYIKILEDLNDKLTEDENNLTYLYNLTQPEQH
jgi:hypothetical protein